MANNLDDYHINTTFRMGGDNTNNSNQTQNQNSLTNDAQLQRTPNKGHINTPSNVAKATPRMMGTRNSSSTIQHQNPHQQPLMPPVEIQTNSSNNVSRPQTQTQPQRSSSTRQNKSEIEHQSQPKQFHRKSLGDWDFLETVGAGSMGKVKLAKHQQTKEVCAIKIVNRATKTFLHKEHSMQPPKNDQEKMERQKALEKEISRDKRTIREASLGQVLYHPHICRLFEMCTMSNHFYMLFEYVQGGQLLDYIIQHGSLREHHARKFARGIASALQYIHGNNIVHRDLKIENIMISCSGEIKIIDFGLSNLFDTKKQLHTFCGSLYFAAPELLKANPYTGPEVDVWSFGVVLYVLVCGKVPFDDENSSVLHEKIKQGKVEYPQHLSIEVIYLLSKMLVVDPVRRATLKQVVDHPWMVRGYDGPTTSYLPLRVPLTVDLLNQSVIKEMFRLEFIDDIEDTINHLTNIVLDEKYIQLSDEYWTTRSVYEQEHSHDLTNFSDPTRSFHPLLSMYYLVDEMIKNKLRKQQGRQQMLLQKQNQELAQQTKLEISNTQYVPTNNSSIVPNPLQSATENVPDLKIPHQISAQDYKSTDEKKDLQILIPPKLVAPEQAHTSPTSRKSPDMQHDDLDYVLSPTTEQSTDYEQRIALPQVHSPSNNQEKVSFGDIFRKLSQRHSNQQHQQYQTPVRTMVENKKPILKSHIRAYSEHVPSSNRIPTFTNTNNYSVNRQYDNNTGINQNASPVRSASQKQPSGLPALPTNAEYILQQQRAKQVEKSIDDLKFEKLTVNKVRGDNEQAAQKARNNNEHDETEDDSNQKLNVSKGRKLHPSARAKSVGHARRESLKFNRPPVPTSINHADTDNTGFLENESRLGSVNLNTAQTGIAGTINVVNSHLQITKTSSYIHELTDQEILDEASNAPAGSMPSIDYPRSLFLKGFFSVQTTSSKPLPIVRYKILSVLKRMNIEFKEVKGGFVCIQKPLNIKEEIPTISQIAMTRTSQDHQAPQMLLPPAATHKRVMSGTPNLSMRRQNSVKYNQPGIPATPLGFNSEDNERSMSSTLLALNNGGAPSIGTGSTHNNNGIISEEISTASLEYINQEDMLTTSMVQDINNVEHANPGSTQNYQYISEQGNTTDASKERPPIKFEIHIVKVRIVGLAGVHFKKVSGNTWMYKELASHILSELNL